MSHEMNQKYLRSQSSVSETIATFMGAITNNYSSHFEPKLEKLRFIIYKLTLLSLHLFRHYLPSSLLIQASISNYSPGNSTAKKISANIQGNRRH